MIPNFPVFDDGMAGGPLTLNELFSGLDPYWPLCWDKKSSIGLNLVLFGGRWNQADLAAQTLALPASSTLYVDADSSTGQAVARTGGYGANRIPLGVAVTLANGLQSYTAEQRAGTGSGGGGGGGGGSSPLTTKGDLYTHGSVDARLAVGNDGSILVADSSQPLGLRWGVSSSTLPQNVQSTDYTTTANDIGGHILHPGFDGSTRTFTIASNANVPAVVGQSLTFVNGNGAGNITIAIAGSDILRMAGTGTTGSRTLLPNGIATALKISSVEWLISGTGLS